MKMQQNSQWWVLRTKCLPSPVFFLLINPKGIFLYAQNCSHVMNNLHSSYNRLVFEMTQCTDNVMHCLKTQPFTRSWWHFVNSISLDISLKYSSYAMPKWTGVVSSSQHRLRLNNFSSILDELKRFISMSHAILVCKHSFLGRNHSNNHFWHDNIDLSIIHLLLPHDILLKIFSSPHLISLPRGRLWLLACFAQWTSRRSGVPHEYERSERQQYIRFLVLLNSS